MSEAVRRVNEFFRNANRADVDTVLSRIILSERQEHIFTMFYIKKQNIGFIADTLCVCPMVIKVELGAIRRKILAVL